MDREKGETGGINHFTQSLYFLLKKTKNGIKRGTDEGEVEEKFR